MNKSYSGFTPILILLILGIIGIVGYLVLRTAIPTSTSTLNPTQTPGTNVTSESTPTLIPTQTTGWNKYIDPYGRYAIKYPSDWFLLEPPSDDLGYATRITSIDLTQNEGLDSHGEVLKSEAYVWIGRDSAESIPEAELFSWLEENPPSDGNVLQMQTVYLADRTVVQRDVKLFAGHTVREFFIATSEGVLVISGEPLESPKVNVLDTVISSIEVYK